MAEPFCRSCGKILPEGVLKCPDCGAPQGAVVPARKGVARASLAGFLLVVSFALGLFQGIYVVVEPELPVNQSPIYGATFPIRGHVVDEAGVSLSDVNVTAANQTVKTDAEGNYNLTEVGSGVVDVEFRAEGRANKTVRVFLFQQQTVNAALEPGEGPGTLVQHQSYRTISQVFRVCGFVLIACSLLTLLGAIAAYRRRSWGLALAGAIAALFVSIPISLLFGGIALYLVVKSRPEFVRLG